MEFNSRTVPTSFEATLNWLLNPFRQRSEAAKEQRPEFGAPHKQQPTMGPHEAAIEDLRCSFDAVMKKLDRIEAKVDLLANKAV